MQWIRSKFIPVLAITFSLAAIVVITLLQQQNAADRDAELSLANVKTALTRLQTAPFQAESASGGNPKRARETITAGKQRVNRALADLRQESPPAQLAQIAVPLRANFEALGKIYHLEVTVGYGRRADEEGILAARHLERGTALLDAAGDEFHQRAVRSHHQAIVGSAAMITLLLTAFGFFSTRSNRLKRENEHLLAASRMDALTDALTGLSNRRALLGDLPDVYPAGERRARTPPGHVRPRRLQGIQRQLRPPSRR